MTGAPGPDGSAAEPSDRDLLTAHLAGDPDAFGTLFRRHRDRLWAVALRTTGDPEEAADALQEALISAYRRADAFRGDAAVTTWLHRIVVNASLDRLRRRKVRAAEPLPDDLETVADRGATVTAAAPVTDPVQAVLESERRARVMAALDTLPGDQRAALVLVDMEGYSVEEVARIFECPTGTIKSRCSRARARVAPLLVDLDPRPPTGSTGNPTRTARVPQETPGTTRSSLPTTGRDEEVSTDDPRRDPRRDP